VKRKETKLQEMSSRLGQLMIIAEIGQPKSEFYFHRFASVADTADRYQGFVSLMLEDSYGKVPAKTKECSGQGLSKQRASHRTGGDLFGSEPHRVRPDGI